MLLDEETRGRPVIEKPAAETDPRGEAGAPSVWKRFLDALLRAFAVLAA
jgi:hypothetical protein